MIALALILFEGGLTAGWQRDPARAASRARRSRCRARLITALVTGLAASWLFDFSTLEGLLLGSIIASTDGAAVFSLLRGSGLRKRLERTLEGEAGFNDPIAVLLVLGFIEWIKHPDYGWPTCWCCSRSSSGSAWSPASRSARWPWRRSAACSSPRRGSIRSRRCDRGASSRSAPPTRCTARASWPCYLCGLALGSAQHPGPHDRHRLPRGPGLGRAARRCSSRSACWCSPPELDDVAIEGTLLALVVVFVARPAGDRSSRRSGAASACARRRCCRLGRAARRRARSCSPSSPCSRASPHSGEFFNIVFFAVLLSTLLQGTTIEPLARRLGVTSDEPALPPTLIEVGAVRAAGRRRHRARHPARRRGGRRAAARPGPAPRRARVAHHARRGGAAAARLHTCSRPATGCSCSSGARCAGELPELLERWRAGPVARPVRPPRTYTGTVPIYTTRPWTADDGDPAHPREVVGREVVEHLRTRRDVPGALVILADGRFAVTGPILMVGPPGQVQAQVRRRLTRGADDAERAWWQEVIGACAL